MELIIFTSVVLIIIVLLGRRLGPPADYLLSRATIERALYRLGDKAANAGESLTITVVGGTALMLGYNARASTRDVDAFLNTPPERHQTRQWIAAVARDLHLPADWLNDGAKGFMQGVSQGPLLLVGRGIMVYQATPEQLLAMKLAAWRREQDQQDAAVVLRAIRWSYPDRGEVWDAIRPYLTVFDVLKAGYAFGELWAELYEAD